MFESDWGEKYEKQPTTPRNKFIYFYTTVTWAQGAEMMLLWRSGTLIINDIHLRASWDWTGASCRLWLRFCGRPSSSSWRFPFLRCGPGPGAASASLGSFWTLQPSRIILKLSEWNLRNVFLLTMNVWQNLKSLSWIAFVIDHTAHWCNHSVIISLIWLKLYNDKSSSRFRLIENHKNKLSQLQIPTNPDADS